MSGADLGRDRSDAHRQVRERGVAERVFELGDQAVAADQPRASEREIEITEHAPARQPAGPFLEGVELAGRVEAAHDGADRGARNDVGADAVGHQGAQHADMRKAARRAAAQHEADGEAVFRMRPGPDGDIAVHLWSQDVQPGPRP